MRPFLPILAAGMLSGLFCASGIAQTQAPAVRAPSSSATREAAASKANAATAAPGAPTQAQVADAKAKGMVWANKSTKVYHKEGQFYGKTKDGSFMTEADAQKAGYKQAKSSPVGQKKSSAKTGGL